MFIGANHNLSFLHPGFSPAHMRTLLSKISPAAICLEVTPDWPSDLGIPTYPQEALSNYRVLLNLPEDQLVVPALIGGRRIDLRRYIESLVREPFRGGDFEAYRAFLAMGR